MYAMARNPVQGFSLRTGKGSSAPCDPDWKSGVINRNSIDSFLYFLFQINFTYFNQILKLFFYRLR